VISNLQALPCSRGLRLLSFLSISFVVFCSSSMQTVAESSEHLTVSPGNLDFQMVDVGNLATLSFHIKNAGSATIQLYRVSSSKSEFHLLAPPVPISLAPTESIEFRITFEPTSPGRTSGLLEIVSSVQAMVTYTLTGIGNAPFAALQLSPSFLNFGSQELNSLSTKNVTVQNSGDVPLNISGVTVMGSGFGFSNVSSGLSLAPKQQATLQVSFRPLSSGVASGRLSILSKSLTSAATLSLAGIGVNPSPPASPPSAATPSLAAPISTPSSVHPSFTSGTGSGTQTVHLAWAASPSSVIGYRVYRGAASGGPYQDYTANPISALSYDDTTVVAGATYYYVVTSVDANGLESTFSNEAIATLPGSPPPSPPPSGGPSSLTTGIAMNGSAALNGTRLRLTSTGANLAGSGWYTTPVNVQTFSNDFTFQLANPTTNSPGNGITFAIQNAGTTALGPSGGGLGYGPDKTTSPSASANKPITKSVAIKLDLVNNAGEGTNSTGMYTNGASPTMPAVTVGNGVNLRSGDIFKVHMNYDGTTLAMTITDTANTTQTFTTSWTINIPGTVGGNTAYVGFTGGTGGSVANQDIITWTYSNSSTTAKTPIVYRSATLPAVSSGPPFRTFTYSGFPDTTGTVLDATAAGDNVTFTVNVPAAGTYDIKLSYKQYPSRGISEFAINGTNVGAPLDQYQATQGYSTFDYGNFTFPAAGNYSFKFTILGKNASATGYPVSFDDFTLTPQ
jgi:hypothetical protein